MPYASVDELPKSVRSKLSAHQQAVFRDVFNSMMEQEGMSESRAFAGAYSQAKQAVQKAMHQGKEVTLDKPFRLPEGSGKKFGVYVKSGDGVKKVTFGDPNMEIRRDDPDARSNFRARHSCDTASDKTSARYWSCKFWQDDISVSDLTKSETPVQILKFDEEQRIIYGFASVVTVNGKPLVDLHGDVISVKTLEKAATEFMLGTRKGLTMHSGEQTHTIIHSLPLTKEIMGALGISSDKEGWVIGVKVHDDATWEKAKSGEFKGFSVGGRARKVALD